MWVQEQIQAKRMPEKPILLVNTRGKVINATTNNLQKCLKNGFVYAPEGSKAGTYYPEYDQEVKTESGKTYMEEVMEDPPELKEEILPKKKIEPPKKVTKKRRKHHKKHNPVAKVNKADNGTTPINS